MIKRCNRCTRSLDTSLFYKNRSSPSGMSSYCKLCMNEINSNTPSSKDRSRTRQYVNRSKTKNFAITLFRNAKQSARKHGLEFNIDHNDVSVPDKCPVLGIPLFRTEGKRTPNTPSIDRINNDRGYVKGNVAVISWRANELKRDATVEELESVVHYMRCSGLTL
jgi:hypothetical protein